MKNSKTPNLLVRIVLIIGMALLAMLALLGVIKIMPSAISSLGSVLQSTIFTPKETIVISLSNNAPASGEEIKLSFDHKGKNSIGKYEFRFECKSQDLKMTIIDGTNRTDVACGSKTQVLNTEFELIPILTTKNSYLDSNIFVDFTKSSSQSVNVTGRSLLTIHNGNIGDSVQATSSKSTSSATTIKNFATSSQNTKINNTTVQKYDLYLVMKDSGVVTNGVFIPKSNFNLNESSSIRFDIGNQGNIATGPWSFTANLPTNPNRTFSSPIQPSLNPGELIEYTLTLENLQSVGANIASVRIISPGNELSTTNNVGVITLNGNTYSGNYNGTNYGKADLIGKVVALGVIDRNTGQFNEASSVSRNARAAVKFEIDNIGTNTSANFVFTANLPSNTNSIFVSPSQSGMYPGESRVYTVWFDNPQNIGSNPITIRIDSSNNVDESSENNNIIYTSILAY